MKKSIYFLLIAAGLMGSTFPIQKLGLNSVDPLFYLTLRFLIATIISFFIFKKGNVYYSIILGFVLSIGYITQIIGINYTTASKAGFITSQYIVFIPIFSYIIEKEKINIFQGISFFLSIIGSYLLAGGINGFNIGDILMIFCAVSFALHIVLITKFSKKVQEKNLLTIQFLTVSIIGIIASFIFKVSTNITTLSFYTILYSAIVGSIIVIYLQLKFQKNVGSNLTAIIFLIQPVFSAFLSAIILNEKMSKNQIYGAIILLLSILISNYSKKVYN